MSSTSPHPTPVFPAPLGETANHNAGIGHDRNEHNDRDRDRDRDSDSDDNHDPNSSSTGGRATKRSRVTQACEPCRKKKIKCGGSNPCVQCVESSDECYFAAPKKRGPKLGSKRSLKSGTAGRRAQRTGGTVMAAGATSTSSASATTASSTAPSPAHHPFHIPTPTSCLGAASLSRSSPDSLSPDPSYSSNQTLNATSSSHESAVIPTAFQPRSVLSSASHLTASHPKISRDDLDELSDNLVVFLSLDDHGRTSGVFTMGDSSGLHLFTKVSRRAAIGIDGGYIPKLYKIIDRLAVPRDFNRCLAVWPGHEHQDVLDMLVDFYYQELHRWFPILPRSQLQEQLDGLAVYLANPPGAPRPTNDKGKPYPYPNMMLIYAFFFYTSAMFEGKYKLTHRCAGGPGALPGQPKFPLSRVFSYHAKQQFSCLGENALSSIEAVQACTFLAIGDVPNVSGNPWLMMGTAVRISVELGIHHVAQLQHSYGKCSFYMPIPEQLTVYARVWCAVYAVEQMCAMALGRPSILSSEDSQLDYDLFLNTPLNRERFPGQDLLPDDSPFVWMVKLMDIAGKITRAINNIHLRKNLQHTLPELHGMLQHFQTSLPPSLQYDFSPDAATPDIQVAFLHIMYFSCVLALYRPFLSSRRLRNDGPLQEQYLSIVETCILAIPTIYLRHREEAPCFPMDASQFVVYCLAGCLAVLEESRTPDRRRKVLRVLHMCSRVLEQIYYHQPEFTMVMRALCYEFICMVEGNSDVQMDDMEREMFALTEQLVSSEEGMIATCSSPDWAKEKAELRPIMAVLRTELRRVMGKPLVDDHQSVDTVMSELSVPTARAATRVSISVTGGSSSTSSRLGTSAMAMSVVNGLNLSAAPGSSTSSSSTPDPQLLQPTGLTPLLMDDLPLTAGIPGVPQPLSPSTNPMINLGYPPAAVGATHPSSTAPSSFSAPVIAAASPSTHLFSTNGTFLGAPTSTASAPMPSFSPETWGLLDQPMTLPNFPSEFLSREINPSIESGIGFLGNANVSMLFASMQQQQQQQQQQFGPAINLAAAAAQQQPVASGDGLMGGIPDPTSVFDSVGRSMGGPANMDLDELLRFG